MSAFYGRTIRRRLSLLAGGSLATTIAVLAAGGAALTPMAARADNECGSPSTNGATADTFQCTDAAPFASITYPATNGNLTLQLQNDVTVTTGGIVITPTGVNSVSITRIADSPANSGDPQITSTTGAGISVIRPALSASGGITVNLTDNDTTDTPLSVTGTTAAIRLINAGTGATTLTTTNGTLTATTGTAVQLGTAGTGSSTFNNRSVVSGATGAVQFTGGGNATLTNAVLSGATGTLLGKVSFENTGTATFNNSGIWRSEGVNNMGSGVSSLSNNGVLAVAGATQGAATLTLSSLETLSGGGRILFGANAGLTATDGLANDRLVTQAALTGTGRLEMDVVLGGAQADCSVAADADCLDLRGGSATGTGAILINPIAGAGTIGARQVLVDVSGVGVLDADAFVLDPANAGYRELRGGAVVMDTGAITLSLVNDTAAKQVYLTSAPDREPAQLAHLGEAAHIAWNMTSSGWLDRQADQRFGAEGGHGVWLSVIAGSVANDLTQSFLDDTIVYDTSYRQRSRGLVGGADIFSAEGWKAGLTAGYVNSEVEFNESITTAEMNGYSVGAYGALSAGDFYLDGIVNYAKLDLESSVLAGESEATSMGAQAEAGYRFVTPAGFAVIEPLVAVAYVTTEIDDGVFTDGWNIGFDEATSLRGAVGLRLSGEMGEAVTTRFSFTGRLWQEFDGEAGIRLAGAGVEDGFTYDDDRDVLGDVAFSVSVIGLAPGLSLDATARLKMKDDYSAGDVGIGVRYAF